MTRRANHWQNNIIANIVKPARRKSVAGFFFEIPESDGGRPARRHIFQRPSPGRRGRAVVRALNPYIIGRRARTRRPAARIVTAARGPDGIRFAPQMICACTAIMPHISTFRGKPMTACLISLALIGLVVIAVRRNSRERRKHSVHPASEARRRTNGFSDDCFPFCRAESRHCAC